MFRGLPLSVFFQDLVQLRGVEVANELAVHQDGRGVVAGAQAGDGQEREEPVCRGLAIADAPARWEASGCAAGADGPRR